MKSSNENWKCKNIFGQSIDCPNGKASQFRSENCPESCQVIEEVNGEFKCSEALCVTLDYKPGDKLRDDQNWFFSFQFRFKNLIKKETISDDVETNARLSQPGGLQYAFFPHQS